MAKKPMTTDPQGELLTQVDENNKVIGSIPRGEAHGTPGIFYRTIYVLVMNDQGEALVHKRSASKDLYPNCWDLSAGGHVHYQDSYEETAARELGEELGLKVSEEDLTLKGEVLVKLPNSGEFFNVFEYHLKPGEKISTAEEEIQETQWMTVDDIKKSMDGGNLLWYERPTQTIRALY
jgi:isopentenyldiphosphate isomerase